MVKQRFLGGQIGFSFVESDIIELSGGCIRASAFLNLCLFYRGFFLQNTPEGKDYYNP